MRTILSLLVLVAPVAFGQLTITDSPSALKPGDDKLTCDQMKTELTAIAADPAFQAVMAQMQGVGAQAFLQLAQHPEVAAGFNPAALAQLDAGAQGAATGAVGAAGLSQLGGAAASGLTQNAATGALGQAALAQLGGAAANGVGQGAAANAIGQAALSQVGGNSANAAAAEAAAQGAVAQGAAQAAEAPKKRGGLFKGIGKGLGGAAGASALGGLGASRGAAAAQAAQVAAMGAAGRAAQAAEQPLLDATAAQVGTLSPQLMRGMELAKLAEAKHCGP